LMKVWLAYCLADCVVVSSICNVFSTERRCSENTGEEGRGVGDGTHGCQF